MSPSVHLVDEILPLPKLAAPGLRSQAPFCAGARLFGPLAAPLIKYALEFFPTFAAEAI